MSNHKANETEMLQEVAHVIGSDLRLADCDIQIQARDGVVVLKGAVEAALARETAEADARRVPGVRDVANDLVVVPHGAEGRSDVDVAVDVRRALERHAGVPHDRLHCSVTGGVVTVTGAVDRWCESTATEAAIGSVPGVRSLENLLQVTESVAPKVVHRAIASALAAHAQAQANNLTVTSLGSEVTVTGVVACTAEKQALLEAVRRVPGVTSVRSQVRVCSMEAGSPHDLLQPG